MQFTVSRARITAPLIALIIGLTPWASQASQSAEQLHQQAKSFIHKDLDQAEELIEEAMSINPTDPEIAFTCGRIMGKQAEDSTLFALSYAKKALKCLNFAVDNAPDQIKFRQGLLNFHLGVPSIAGGDTDIAFQQVKAIRKLDSLQGVQAEIRYLRATEQANLLTQRFEQFTQEFPSNAAVHFEYGLHLQTQKDYQMAFQSFNRVISFESSENYQLSALYQLGRNAVFGQLHLKEGIAALKRYVVEFNGQKSLPPIPWAHFRMAQLYQLIGEKALAKQNLKLAKHTDDPTLKKAIKKFNHK